MTPEDFPQNRMDFFQEKLNLASQGFETVKPHAAKFAARTSEYVAHFMEYFTSIDQTKLILDRGRRERLARTKGAWFRSLFEEGFSRDFQHMVWKSGIRHVEINLDMRFVNLAYSMVRQFCHRVIREELSPQEGLGVAGALDNMLDFCVLLATDSFITTTARCDLGVIQGIAHQVRNPVTVIGGSIRRLMHKDSDDPAHQRTYDMVLSESQRLERMLLDVGVYSKLFGDQAANEVVELSPLLAQALERLAPRFPPTGYQYREDFSPMAGRVTGDRQALGTMFLYLLENALEALDPADPRLEITSSRPEEGGMVEVSIFNTGQALPPDQLEAVRAPFHSPKPMGTGFGLPIAELVARRHLGWLALKPKKGGVVCLVRLPGA